MAKKKSRKSVRPAHLHHPRAHMRLFLKVICVEPPQLLEKTVDPRDVVRDVLYRVQCGEPAEALALVYEGRELPIA